MKEEELLRFRVRVCCALLFSHNKLQNWFEEVHNAVISHRDMPQHVNTHALQSPCRSEEGHGLSPFHATLPSPLQRRKCSLRQIRRLTKRPSLAV